MKKFVTILLAGAIFCLSACNKGAAYQSLIITGQGDHNWKVSSSVLKLVLDQTGLFSTRIMVTPGKGEDMEKFNPDFSKYNLIVLDYNGDSWTKKVKTAFVDYVRNGGGIIIYGESNHSFSDWKEFNEIIGLGAGDSRTAEKSLYVFYKDFNLITDTLPEIKIVEKIRKEYEIAFRNPEHPIVNGLPSRWMHAEDEFISGLNGPAESMEIIATANKDGRRQELRISRDEPVLMAVTYGKGRVFHTVIGNITDSVGPAIQCAGFITTFQRGAEWAACGKVTQKIPLDFPNLGGVALRPGYKELTIEEIVHGIESYQINRSNKYFSDLQQMIRRASAESEDLGEYEKLMVRILKNKKATVEGKKLLLRELSWMGSEYCIPVIKELEKTEELKEASMFALQRLYPDHNH
jgi:uncharacterized protein